MFTAACGGPVATVCESHISLFEGIPTLALFTLLKMCGFFFYASSKRFNSAMSCFEAGATCELGGSEFHFIWYRYRLTVSKLNSPTKPQIYCIFSHIHVRHFV